jgi:hypothetical protein
LRHGPARGARLGQLERRVELHERGVCQLALQIDQAERVGNLRRVRPVGARLLSKLGRLLELLAAAREHVGEVVLRGRQVGLVGECRAQQLDRLLPLTTSRMETC